MIILFYFIYFLRDCVVKKLKTLLVHVKDYFIEKKKKKQKRKEFYEI